MSPLALGAAGIILLALGFATWKAPRLTSVTVWALLAALSFAAALLLVLPFDFGSLALWLALAMPLIWVAFQFLCYWDKAGWRVSILLILIFTCSTALILVTPPPA